MVSEFIQTFMSPSRRDVLEVLEETQGCSRSMRERQAGEEGREKGGEKEQQGREGEKGGQGECPPPPNV